MTLLPAPGTLWLPFREARSGSAARLRVGVVLDCDRRFQWVDALLAHLRRIPNLEVLVLTIAAPVGPQSGSNPPPWLVERLYSASRRRFDPFRDAVLDGVCPANLESVDEIRASGCGVIIWLADRRSGIDPRKLAEHGVLTVRLGDGDRGVPFWDEVAGGSVTSRTTIFWHDTSLERGRAVGTAETPTIPGLFVTWNAEQPLVAAIRMLAGLCLEIQRAGPQFEERILPLPATRLTRTAGPGYPSNIEAVSFALKKLARSAHCRWTTRGRQLRWFVAMRPNSGESIADAARPDLRGFTEVPLPEGVAAMADPFPWEASGREYLLFEAVAPGQSRGRIGCVEISPEGRRSEMTIILDRPYHLSYPCVVCSGGELFLLPESSEAKRVDLYRFSRFPWDMELVSSPVDGVAVVDTTPVLAGDRWYVFTTTVEPFMETVLFTATRLEGPWKLHPSSPVSTSVKSCRSAGNLFWRGGRLFRPTQDCTVRYGYAIAVNEVTRLTPHEFEERTVSYVPPHWMRGLVGTHTWNENSAFQVIDGIRYVR